MGALRRRKSGPPGLAGAIVDPRARSTVTERDLRLTDSQERKDSSTWQPGNGSAGAAWHQTRSLGRRRAALGRAAAEKRLRTSVKAGASTHTSSQQAQTT